MEVMMWTEVTENSKIKTAGTADASFILENIRIFNWLKCSREHVYSIKINIKYYVWYDLLNLLPQLIYCLNKPLMCSQLCILHQIHFSKLVPTLGLRLPRRQSRERICIDVPF